ncbi:MAG: hypothetical protein ACR2F2_08155 [Pyrinomonadaceae bacterium]
MLRAVILSVALFIGLGALIPLATDNAEAGQQKQRKSKKRNSANHKKYSKAWWRAYRARKKGNSSLAKRKEALRLKQIRLAKERQEEIARNGGKWVKITTWNGENWVSKNEWIAITSENPTVPVPDSVAVKSAVVKDEPVAKSKNRRENRMMETPNAEAQFKVTNKTGEELGSASITVVGAATGDDRDAGRYKTLSGVSMSALRRTVIDQMIRENGWVVNDYQKEVGGKKVYVVVAQSPGLVGQTQSRMFYFTEVDGRIYSVATNSPTEKSGQIADESEKIVNVLQRRSSTTQVGLR